MALVQHCEMRIHGQRCYRIARVWIEIQYETWGGGTMSRKRYAVCETHRNDSRKVAELGPVEVVSRSTGV